MASDRFPKQHHPENEMVITAAHIPAIVALIAGILILIMPRLLNFIVAIYLIVIGLVGLGLLRWLHM
jgi:archaellum biogenesis protein FlaJ (TadC family)